MKHLLIYTILFWSSITFAQYREWHVQTLANGGSPAGLGTLESPWDLQTAFNQPNTIVKPGDTIWLHSGIYNNRYTCSLIGLSTNYITVSSYPGEWAILNGNLTNNNNDPNPITCPQNSRTNPEPEEETYANTPDDLSTYVDDDELDTNPVLKVTGGYITFKDFEVNFMGNYSRIKYDTNPIAFQKITGISHSPNTDAQKSKFLNLVIKNIPGPGFSSWKNAADSEIYGCIIYNNGYVWFHSDSINSDGTFDVFGKGPGIYTQNNSRNIYNTADINNPRLVKNNIIHNNYDSGVFVWSATLNPSSNYLKNFELCDNILFNNGNPARRHPNDDPADTSKDSKPNLVIDSDSNNEFNHPTDIDVHDNIFYLNSMNYISGIRVENSDNVNIHCNLIAKGTKGCAFGFYNTNLNFTDNDYWGKFLQIGATVESYSSNNWNLNDNRYFIWNFKEAEMCHIPNPILSSQEIRLPFKYLSYLVPPPTSWFKQYYTTAETGSNGLYQKIAGTQGLMWNGQYGAIYILEPQVKVVQNEHNPNLFYVTLFNTWGNYIQTPYYTSLPVDFSNYNIPNGSSVVIRDVQNYNNSYTTDIYNGFPINLSLLSSETEKPLGYFEDGTCSSAAWASQFSRKPDFSVYTVEFGCVGILYDNYAYNITDPAGYKLYNAKNNIFFGSNYVANTSSDIVANASKQIVLKPNTHIKSMAKFHAKIVEPCPDLTYIGEGSTSKQSRARVNSKSTIQETEMFIIYPNPNSGVFKIESLKATKIKKVVIRDVNNAKTVFEQTYNHEKTVDINISSNSLGLYVVEVTFEDNSTLAKTVIKE